MKYTVLNKQNNSDYCFVCGVDNDASLHTHFYELNDKRVLGVLLPHEIYHQSYPNRMHGGVVSSLIDETIGRAVQIGAPDLWAVTIDLEIKYILPVPLDEVLYVVGWLTTEPRMIFEGIGYICNQKGVIFAKGKGKYRRLTVEQITGGARLNHNQWKLVESDFSLSEVDLPE